MGLMSLQSFAPLHKEADLLAPAQRLAAPRVLVVEDEMTVAMLIEDMVSELNYEVTAVVSRLEDAMRLADSDNFDLAILDVHLNGKTVFPFAAALERREIPYLFATAYGPRGIPAGISRSHGAAEAVRSGGTPLRLDDDGSHRRRLNFSEEDEIKHDACDHREGEG